MSSREEQVVQIEASLEQRFFRYVPQSTDPSHSGWSPERHRTHRLSRSLAAYTLAELIYTETEALQGEKGYLSIFRNLTDSQPLADRVLGRLSEQRP